MEHVTIKYPESRSALIDGEEAGMTNTVLRVEQGTHTFSLGNPQDYQPPSKTVKVENTTPVKPLEVTFVKTA